MHRGTWKEEARAAGYWPVFSDWCHHYALDPTGQPVRGVSTDWREAEPVRAPTMRNCILAEASIRYSQWAHVRPVRGPTDQVCTSCGGTGTMPLEGIMCSCGGLGWIPAGESQAHEADVAEARARELGLTPIWSDECGVYALDANARLVVGYDPGWHDRGDVRDRAQRHRVFAQASARSAAWDHLRPVRGANDPTCRSCKGSGVSSAETCYWCGGVGWMPAETRQPS